MDEVVWKGSNKVRVSLFNPVRKYKSIAVPGRLIHQVYRAGLGINMGEVGW